MKRKFSKILGVGLSLALMVSLLLTAVPVLADVSQPTVDPSDDEISAAAVTYTISFRINDELAAGADITVRFPDDTDIGAADVADDGGVSVTSGIGSGAGDVLDVTVVVDEDDMTVEITLTTITGGGNNIGVDLIGPMAYIQLDITGIVNPTEPGDYTLEVQTSEEDDYVVSETYEIEVPTVGGFVYVYNPSNILLATYGGVAALDAVDGVGHFDQDDYTIKVGPGTYLLGASITITGEGLTLESADGAEDTIIDAAGNGFIITGDEVTIEGFTIDDAGTAISIDAEDVTVTNNIITDATIGVEIDDDGDNATVSDNVIEDSADGIVFVAGGGDLDDVDITGNEITGADNEGGIVFLGGNENIDITDNTITDNEVAGIYFDTGGATSTNIDIIGNTISENEADGIWIDTGNDPVDLVIRENTIVDNEDVGLRVDSWDDDFSVFMFNDIYGNGDNVDTAVDITNAVFNWWGVDDSDDIEDTITGDGDVTFEPWLTDMQGTVSAGSNVDVSDGAVAATAVSSLDARDEADVRVSGMDDDGGEGADIISAFKYAANPEASIDDALAFYDVYIILNDVVALDEVNGRLRFYDSAINTGSVASFWTGDFWAEATDQLARDGIIWVTINEDTLPTFEDLEGTAFVVVGGEAVEAETVTLTAPEAGATDVSSTAVLTWGTVAGAETYNITLTNATTGLSESETGLTSTAYTATGLDLDTPYYWQVTALDDGEVIGESAIGTFTTKAEPVEALPPVVIQEAPSTPDIIIEQPDIIVPLPAATPITPGWIYVIIAVGAVLVIALIVLIVRTRRVA